MHKLDNENSAEHWKFINVKNKIVLDLGCGRWNKVERVDDSWLTTPEHFIFNGATKVIGVDIDHEEISWFKNKYQNDLRYEFILKSINSENDIKFLYDTYKPNCVKFDIESNEKFLFKMNESDICSIEEYYIETHGQDMYEYFINTLPSFKYHINEQIDLIHTSGLCKVIFASKK